MLRRRKARVMNERASVLITAVWVVSVFSIITTSLAFHAGEEILLMKRELKDLNNRLYFSSGLNEAVRMIQEDPDPHQDSRDKPWFGDLKLEGPLQNRLSIHL